MRNSRRCFCFILAMILCLSLLPMGVMADSEAEEPAATSESIALNTDTDNSAANAQDTGDAEAFGEEYSGEEDEYWVSAEESFEIENESVSIIDEDDLELWSDGTSVTQSEAIAWAASKVGQSLDYDGAWGAQCVDFIMYYYKFLGESPFYGNGADYASASNALRGGWTRIYQAQPQPGDILIYTGTSSNPYGHVGIYESDYVHYHQNVKGYQGVVRCTWHYKETGGYNVYWGVIRPNFGSGSGGGSGGDSVSISFNPSDRQSIGTDEVVLATIITSNMSMSKAKEVGIDVYDESGNLLASKREVPQISGDHIDVWYKLKEELGMTLIPGATYKYRFYANIGGIGMVKSGYSFTMPGAVRFYIDVNGINDGAEKGDTLGYGTFDVYINGNLVANDVGDYYETWPAGTTYEIRDIQPSSGKEYTGLYSGSRTGTLNGHTDVKLAFDTIPSSLSETPHKAVFNGHTYYYFTTPVTWYAAKQLCENMGGYLVAISSAEENAFVYSLANSSICWIGFTDIGGEGSWRWASGENVSYTNWLSGEPNNSTSVTEGSENYAHIWDNGLWNDTTGTNKYPFVCEIKSANYTVTYNANGGTGAPSSQTKTQGQALTLSSARPTRSGYTFQGWSTSSTAISAQYQPGGSYTNDGNVTLYAVWRANSVSDGTYSFDLSGVIKSSKTTGYGKVKGTSAGSLYARVTWVYTLKDGQSLAYCAIKPVDSADMRFSMVSPSAPFGAKLDTVQLALVTDQGADQSGAYSALAFAKLS